MNITKSSVVGALLGLSLVAACGRDKDPSNNTIDAGGGDTGSAGGLTVKDVQADSMKSGTAIELKGVVVTAIDSYGGKTGDFWVQDTDGGARSGVHVFGASSTDVSKLQVGDLVDIKGAQKYEYANGANASTPSTQTLTEVEGTAKGTLVVTKVGTGTVPAPHVLDSVAIAAMSATDRATFLEDWEGVPVTLQKARPSSPGTFGSDDDQKSFDVTNVLLVESNMAAFPASSAVNTTCYASITGVVDFVVGKFTLLPTATTGFVDGGTGCAAPTEYTMATIAEIQAGTKTGFVKLTGVYVTAASFFNGAASKTIWVSDGLVAAAGTGLEVFSASSGVDATTRPPGTRVDIQGQIIEFNNILTEVAQNTAAVTLNTASAGAPTALTNIPVATLGDVTNGKPYEGSLVTITNVIVIDTGSATGNRFKLADNNNNVILMDDDVISGYKDDTATAVPAKGKCYKSITGVMDAQMADNARTINPRTVAEMVDGVAGTDCTGTVPP